MISDPSDTFRNAGVALAHALIDELARSGVGFACLSPGSRSTPLALALADHPDIRLHVTLDERSAAFIALGAARAGDRPAVMLTTSGTAAANVFPAVQEAHHGRVPLIVLTADRPPELRHTGANQTIDQIKLFGDAVRWFVEVGAVSDGHDDARYWRSLAGRAVAVAGGSPAGPVHLNIALREPLISPDRPSPSVGSGSDRRPQTEVSVGPRSLDPGDIRDLALVLARIERGAIVAGPGPAHDPGADRLAEALGWPLLADPLSNQRRGPNAIANYDALLRHDAFAADHVPEVVLRTGALGISKSLIRWIGTAERHLLVDPDGWWLDPERSLDGAYTCEPGPFFEALQEHGARRADGPWLESWKRADSAAATGIDRLLDARQLSEPRLVRDLVSVVPSGSNVFVGASMPFRDVEWFTRARSDIRFLGNRGTNGIDGSVGTPLGVAMASPSPTFALIGDLALLHDQNALLMRPEQLDLTFVIPNNDGGGIFSFLPQAELESQFEHLFGTPHGRDLARLASFYGCSHVRVEEPAVLERVLRERPSGIRIIEVPTDRAATVELHGQVHDAVISALREL